MRRLLLLTLTAASLAATCLPAQAGMFDDTEARAWIEDLRKKVDQMDKQAEILGRNQLDFANQIEALKTEIARMRGQIEVLTYELEATQKRQKDFYVDLDSRLRVLETPPEPKAEAAPKIDPQAETAAYEAAVTALKASQFKPAAEGFIAFIQKYPQSTLLASAHYWAAYAHVQLKEHARAAELFGKFATSWPDDERTPGALESRVTSLETAKDLKGARATLELLAEKYPASEAGKRAKLRLKKK
jgi:tol-pal system protein YbgF